MPFPVRVLLLFALSFGAMAQALLPESPRPRQAEAQKFAEAWLELDEAGDHAASYALLTDIFKGNVTERQWLFEADKIRRQNGKLVSRTLRRIVWYDNPEDAPLPGIYAAVEFDSEFEHVKRHFQYLILHSENGAPFRIMRSETTMIDESGSTAPPKSK